MALWEAPITPTVTGESEERVLDRRGGLSAGSRPISVKLDTGRGPVVGEAPVHRTSSFEVTDTGDVSELCLLGLNSTFQLFDYGAVRCMGHNGRLENIPRTKMRSIHGPAP